MVILLVCSGKKQEKTSEKDVKKSKVDTDSTTASIKVSNGKGSKKSTDVEKKETNDIANIEQRVRPLSSVCVCVFLYTEGLYMTRNKSVLDIILICLFYLQKEFLDREIEKRYIRTNPLGKDRDYNRYWFFRKESRIFVESCDHKQWGYYATKTQVLTIDSS